MMDPKKSAEMSKLVRQSGKLFLKAEMPDKALDIFERIIAHGNAEAAPMCRHGVGALRARIFGRFEQRIQSRIKRFGEDWV